MDIYGLDIAAANNNSAPPNGAPENMEYEEVNDTLREFMANMKRWQVAAQSGVTTAGSSTAYTLTSGQTLGAYANGQTFAFMAHATSTGAVTLNVDGLGAVAVRDARGNQLGSGDLQANGIYVVTKVSASWRVVGAFATNSVRALAAPVSFTTTGAGDAYVVTTGQLTAYANGQIICFTADRANTGAATINIDGLGAEDLRDPDDAALAANDLVANQTCWAVRVSGRWRCFAGLPVNLATQVVGVLPVANGGTNATSAAAARTSLGAQAQDADLDAIAAITATKGHQMVGNGTTWAAVGVGTNRQIWRADSTDAEGIVWGDQIPSLAVQATTTGTAIDFTGIPAGVNRITVTFDVVSLSGTDNFLVQLGDSGGVETTGYGSTSAFTEGSSGSDVTDNTTGFVVYCEDAARPVTGHMQITRITGTNRWISSHTMGEAAGGAMYGSGAKTLSDTLDRVRIDTSGTNTFDAGQIVVTYE